MEGLMELVEEQEKIKGFVLVTCISGPAAGSHFGFRDGACVYCEAPMPREELETLACQVQSAKREGSAVLEADGERYYCEYLGGQPELVICGGGHVAEALARMAVLAGLPVTAVEDRPFFADRMRKTGARTVICDGFSEGMERVAGGKDVYFAVMTRGHRYDRLCLEKILQKEYAYVGMMGSRSRVALLKKAMLAEGADRERMESLHAPIGLNIGSETPAEIAVSVLAEIIQCKNSGRPCGTWPDEIRRALKAPGEKALATIVSRRGSAPRQTGTKMVIFKDGRTAGTIGGGCAEAELIAKARALLRGQEAIQPEKEEGKTRGPQGACALVQIDLTNQEAEEEGMVCGGLQEIFLEVTG